MKRLMGGVLVASLLAVLPAPALGAGARPGFSLGPLCREEWQLVDYGLIIYLQEPSARAKEQLSHELSVDLRLAAWDCGAP